LAIGEEIDGPPPHIRYRRALHVRSALRDLVKARHVMYSIAERDLRSRYSQMALGFAWDIIGPVSLTIVMTLFLSRATGISTYGLPRPLFVYIGIMPWSFFQGGVSSAGSSLVSNNSLLNKVYVPREIFPLANIGEQVIDTVAASTAIIALMIIFQRAPKMTALWLPIPLLIVLIFTVAISLVVSGLTVYLRDMRQAIPVALQLGLFANPIFYDLRILSPNVRLAFAIINPLSVAIDDVRRCVFYGQAPRFSLTVIAAVVASIELVVAYIVFKQMETGFADVA
jgi:ABC-type polysaccharide/polyol phosphate export permease